MGQACERSGELLSARLVSASLPPLYQVLSFCLELQSRRKKNRLVKIHRRNCFELRSFDVFRFSLTVSHFNVQLENLCDSRFELLVCSFCFLCFVLWKEENQVFDDEKMIVPLDQIPNSTGYLVLSLEGAVLNVRLPTPELES